MPVLTVPLSPTKLDEPAPNLTPQQLNQSTIRLYADPSPPSKAACASIDTWVQRGTRYPLARSLIDYDYHNVVTLERMQCVYLREQTVASHRCPLDALAFILPFLCLFLIIIKRLGYTTKHDEPRENS